MDINKIKVDIKKQDEGVWVDLDKDTSVLVARLYNSNFKVAFEKITAPYQRNVKRGTLDEDIAEKIFSEVMAKTILLDWKGLKEDDKEIPYSYEKCLEILSNPKLRAFKEEILEIAGDANLYREEEIVEAKGKLKSS